jgi:hypothetical protein
MPMILRLAASLLSYRMGVVEPHNSFAVPPVKGKRIVQTVGFLRCDRNPRNHESDPVSLLRIDDEGNSIQFKQSVEGRIVQFHLIDVISK